MKAPAPPKAVAVEVVAAQPTADDMVLVAGLAAEKGKPLPGAAYIVKVKLASVPEPTSRGFALYVGDLRIPKYWEYPQGIWFKVFDPDFFAACKGRKLRFSPDDVHFTDTGLTLAAPKVPAKNAARGAARLPSQDEVLKAPAAGRKTRAVTRRRSAR